MDFVQRPKPVVLIILDGWGIAANNPGNAISLTPTPTYTSLVTTFPHTLLEASGEAVGLPKGEDGNTETGHLNLGAGQIVYQDLPRINQSIANGTFFSNPVLNSAFDHALKNNSTVHLLGLIGAGGVHSSIDHLFALLRLAKQKNVSKVALHCITDGRDSPPTSAINYIGQVKNSLKQFGVGYIASIIGRYYAMDRDHRWERTEIAYKALTQGVGIKASKPEEAVLSSYQANITDEFIKPIIIINSQNQPLGLIKENDSVIFYNFRIDRPRQLTKAFVFPNFEYVTAAKEGFDPYMINYSKTHLNPNPPDQNVFNRGPLIKNLHFVTMTEYEKGLPLSAAFPPVIVDMPLSRVISEMGLRQLKMAETEKERFVTYYFNGQREDPFMGEDRIIIPSPSVPTYDQKPEMSSKELTQTLIERIQTGLYDFIVVNYANPDMVAHTGNMDAAKIAVKVTDNNLRFLTDMVHALGGITLITADHGNIEEMLNLQTGGVDTEHSVNPVPLIITGPQLVNQVQTLSRGILADVAPTILHLMGLPQPTSMSGRPLL